MAHSPPLPTGVRLFYSIGNVTLNCLNFIWFRAMVRAVLKRFDTKPVPKRELDAQKLLNGQQNVKQFEVRGTHDEEFEEEAGIRRRQAKK